MVQNIANQNSAFSGINRVGMTQNGRVIYEITDYSGNEVLEKPHTKYQNFVHMCDFLASADTFEKSYKDIIETAPKIQKYALEHSSEKDVKRRKNLSRIIMAAGAVIGAGVPIYMTRKSSTIKQVLAAAGGLVAGLAAGFGISLKMTSPPGMMKFSKAAKNISNMDIQPLNETA